MFSRSTSVNARLAAFAALLAMCLRLMLPMLHGGHDCHHGHAGTDHVAAAVEHCACGAVHVAPAPDADASEEVGNEVDGQHEDGDAPCSTCLACQLEDQSPGGAPLAVLVVAAQPAPAPEALRCHEDVDVFAACVRPPPRAPPLGTV